MKFTKGIVTAVAMLLVPAAKSDAVAVFGPINSDTIREFLSYKENGVNEINLKR
jgi:hypothetical protein